MVYGSTLLCVASIPYLISLSIDPAPFPLYLHPHYWFVLPIGVSAECEETSVRVCLSCVSPEGGAGPTREAFRFIIKPDVSP